MHVCWGGGGSPKGLVRNLLMQFFTVGGSKISCFEPYFLHIVTTQNDHPKYVKHILGNIYVFSILFGYWVRMWGGGVSGTIGTQPANAVFHHGQLKNLMIRNLFFSNHDLTK